MLEKVYKRQRRHTRIRARITGTAERPRLSVYRSNTSIYAQLIDDVAGKTLCASSDMKASKGTKIELAKTVGAELGKAALALGITSVVFDRGGFLYAGRVKALADAAREAGLTF
ncbi:MAG: 50S ribosomal protein L18 [Patescibacteria group bacterium]